MALPDPPEAAYTVKELVIQVGNDVRALDHKLDAYIEAHGVVHSTEGVAAIMARTDPEQTVVGRLVLLNQGRLTKLEKEAADADAVSASRRVAGQRRDWVIGLVAGACVAVVTTLMSAAFR